MTFHRPGWQQAEGVVGDAVRFGAASSYGVATGTEDENPGTADFALAVTFTSDPIASGVGYSGNVFQKGLYDRQGQVKISAVAARGGTTTCRVKGRNGFRLMRSRVVVDDGAWHTVLAREAEDRPDGRRCRHLPGLQARMGGDGPAGTHRQQVRPRRRVRPALRPHGLRSLGDRSGGPCPGRGVDPLLIQPEPSRSAACRPRAVAQAPAAWATAASRLTRAAC